MRTVRSMLPMVISVAAVVGCGSTTPMELGNGAGGGAGSGATGGGAGATTDAGGGGASSSDASADVHWDGATGPAYALCGGAACAANEECCLVNGKCFDPTGDPSACPTPPPNGHGNPCGSNADCPDGWFCAADNPESCLGTGHCVDRNNCGSCPACAVCGCDGVTYPNIQSACAAGVRGVYTSGSSTEGCGVTHPVDPELPGTSLVTFCGSSLQCPTGQDCCFITGQCYDPAQPVLCALAPPGADYPCLDSSMCKAARYCDGPAPCDSPGYCVPIVGSGGCGSQLSPVCGCDGVSYTSDACAVEHGVRIAATGECLDGG